MKNFNNAIATLVLIIAPVTLSATSIGTSYSTFIFENATVKGSSLQGGIAVGGNASFSSVSVGTGLAADANRYDIVAGGSLHFNNGSIKGGAISGGKATTANYSSYGAVTGNADVTSVVDFESQAALLSKSSEYWGSLTANGSAEYKWGGYLLNGIDSGLNVFNLDAGILDAVSYLNLSVPKNSTVLFNIYGMNAGITNMGFSGLPTISNVIFNFVDATSLSITGVSVSGSVLAPNADVKFMNGNILGQLVAKNLATNHGTSIQGTAFNGGLPSLPVVHPPVDPSIPASDVPEPQTYAMAAMGLLAIGFFRRKK